MFEIVMKRRVFLLVLLAFLFTLPDFSGHTQSRGLRGSVGEAIDSFVEHAVGRHRRHAEKTLIE